MKKLLPIIFICFVLKLSAQQGMYRVYPQNSPPMYFSYHNCEMNNPVKTSDNGYIFSFLPWSQNLHNAYPTDAYIIKTDSNLIPQWKKPVYASAVALPTGGIILFYNTMYFNYLYNGTHVEKITASGVKVWSKVFMGEDIVINDGVSYSNKIRAVGRKRSFSMFPYFYTEISQPYTLEIDTLGNFISQSLFTNSNNSSVDFSKIKLDSQGNLQAIPLQEPIPFVQQQPALIFMLIQFQHFHLPAIQVFFVKEKAQLSQPLEQIVIPGILST